MNDLGHVGAILIYVALKFDKQCLGTTFFYVVVVVLTLQFTLLVLGPSKILIIETQSVEAFASSTNTIFEIRSDLRLSSHNYNFSSDCVCSKYT